MHKVWTRAEECRWCKESHEIFPIDTPIPRRITFNPSYEREEPHMSLLLGWEYGRVWLKEHNEFVHKEFSNAKPPFIEADFSWWVNKRATILDRRQIFLKNKQNPHTKNCNLSSFATSKKLRQKRNGSVDGKGAGTKKAKKCNCKDCMQRRCGGQNKNKMDKNVHNYSRKLMTMPWY